MGYTQLSPTGLPGRTYTFLPKTAADAVPKGDGPFTVLSAMGLPGQIHTFSAKTEAEVIEILTGGGGSKSKLNALKMKTAKLHQEDQDILEFVMSFVLNR